MAITRRNVTELCRINDVNPSLIWGGIPWSWLKYRILVLHLVNFHVILSSNNAQIYSMFPTPKRARNIQLFAFVPLCYSGWITVSKSSHREVLSMGMFGIRWICKDTVSISMCIHTHHMASLTTIEGFSAWNSIGQHSPVSDFVCLQ